MLYVLILLQVDGLVKYGLLLAINFLLNFTGFGVFMGVVTIGLFALLCYWRLRGFLATPVPVFAAGFLIACISLASFFVRYRFEPAVDCFVFPHPRPGEYAWFAALMFSTFSGIRSPLFLVSVLGTLLLLFAFLILGAQLERLSQPSTGNPMPLIATTLLGYSILFAAGAALGRVCLGLPEAAQSPRYSTLLIPAFLAIYLGLRAGVPSRMRATALVALVLVLIPGHAHVTWHAAGFAERKRAWAACYRETEDITRCDTSTQFKIYPDPSRTRLKEKLDHLKRIHANLFAQ